MNWLFARLLEGSTYGGLAAIVGSVGTAFPELASYTTAVAGVLGTIAFMLKDKAPS